MSESDLFRCPIPTITQTLSSSPSSSESSFSLSSSISHSEGKERTGSTGTAFSSVDDSSEDGHQSLKLEIGSGSGRGLESFERTRYIEGESPEGGDNDTIASSSQSLSGLSIGTNELWTPPDEDPATYDHDSLDRLQSHDDHDQIHNRANLFLHDLDYGDGVTPKAEFPPSLKTFSPITTRAAPQPRNIGQGAAVDSNTTSPQPGFGFVAIPTTIPSEQATNPVDIDETSHSRYNTIKRDGTWSRKHASFDHAPPAIAKAVGSYFPIFGNLENPSPPSPPNAIPTSASERALHDVSKKPGLPTHLEGVETLSNNAGSQEFSTRTTKAGSSPLIGSSLTGASPEISSTALPSNTNWPTSGIANSSDVRRLSISSPSGRSSMTRSSSTSSRSSLMSRPSLSGCSISTPKSPSTYHTYLLGSRSSSSAHTGSHDGGTSDLSSRNMESSTSSTGSNISSRRKSSKTTKVIPPTPRWALPPSSPSSSYLSGIVSSAGEGEADSLDAFSAEFETALFRGHEGEWVETMKAEDGRICLMSYKEKYVVLIWVPGFSFEDIVVTARKENTLHVVADQWDDEDHAQWDIRLGEDAVMTSIRAKFNKHQLEVTIKREELSVRPIFLGTRATSFPTFDSPSIDPGSDRSPGGTRTMAKIGSRLDSSSRNLNLKQVRPEQRYSAGTAAAAFAAGGSSSMGLGVSLGDERKVEKDMEEGVVEESH